MMGVCMQTDWSLNQYFSRSARQVNRQWMVVKRDLASSRKKERLGLAVEVSKMVLEGFRYTYNWRERERAGV